MARVHTSVHLDDNDVPGNFAPMAFLNEGRYLGAVRTSRGNQIIGTHAGLRALATALMQAADEAQSMELGMVGEQR